MKYKMTFEYEGRFTTLPEIDQLTRRRIENSLPKLREGDGIINAIDSDGNERPFKARKMRNIKFTRI